MRQLIKNADVFDGTHEQLKENVHIVIEDNKVKEFVTGEISEAAFERVLDAEGYMVIPGLTDSHVHLCETADLKTIESMRLDEAAVRSAKNAYEMLLRGFTTVRDAGGTVLGVKTSIDNGYIDGPRIFPSNGAICQTSGHCDARGSRAQKMTVFGSTSPVMDNGNWILADGVPEVLKAVREQLFLGASQIKLMLGGGIASVWDKLWTIQYTYEEMKAAVDAAADFGTYVLAHIYTTEAMKRAAKAGVRCFEHAQLMDKEVAEIMAAKDIWLCPCPQFAGAKMGNYTPDMQEKWEKVRAGEIQQTELIHRYNLKILYGTDLCGDKEYAQANQLQSFVQYKERFGSYMGLRAATGNVNELIKLTTYQNPYPDGKIGVLEPGAFADLLLIEGNPVSDLEILTDVDRMKIVMKDGIIYKNEVPNRLRSKMQ